MTPLRVGILGFGGAGLAHAYYYSRFPSCRVTKCMDPKPEGRERIRARCPGAEIYGHLDRFWDDLDVVSICAPDAWHAEYIAQALSNNLHVLCEKPLTDSIQGIRTIKEAQRRAPGRVVAVLHQMRFVPLHQRMHDLVQGGALGTVSYLEGCYVHDLTERAFRYDDWRDTFNATPLVYAGCHLVDLLRWLVHDEVEEVFAMANAMSGSGYPESDLNAALLRFRSGTIGKVLVTFGSKVPQDHSVRIYGNKGTIENALFFSSNGRQIIHSPILVQTELGEPLKQLRANLAPWLIGKSFEWLGHLMRRGDGEYYPHHYPVRLYEHSLACVRAIGDFLNAIETGRTPLCSVDESARTVLAALAGVESYRTGRSIAVAKLDDVLV